MTNNLNGYDNGIGDQVDELGNTKSQLVVADEVRQAVHAIVTGSNHNLGACGRQLIRLHLG